MRDTLREPLFVKIDSLAVPLFCDRFERRGKTNALATFADIDSARRADLRARFTQDVHNVQNASAGGDEVLDDDDLLTRLKAALDLVLAAVVLAGRAHIAHGKAHHMADDGGVGDARRARAHQQYKAPPC